ncbi:MAG TPA: hypothetical protein VEA69_25395 [Tepidisphaeraceae bacterium]|nr:hypothetical protein [Tepidisphaeraceae bacterium]
MSKRALDGLKLPPTTRREMERMLRDLRHEPELTPEQRVAFDQQVEQAFPGGFDRRDEANALVAMAVRNGPLENLHAGRSSPLLDDDTLSRLTDDDVRTIMVFATRTVAMMLWMRDEAPEVYQRYVRAYAARYCRSWERTS